MFVWDDAKNAGNQRKHGVSFDSATLVFDDPLHVTRQDRIENGELRWQTLAACRTLVVDSEKRPQRAQFLPDSPPHSPAMGQEAGEKWAAAAVSQPTIPKPDRLLGMAEGVVLLLVAHTWHETEGGEEFIRIISARRATRLERNVYEKCN